MVDCFTCSLFQRDVATSVPAGGGRGGVCAARAGRRALWAAALPVGRVLLARDQPVRALLCHMQQDSS